MEALSLWDNVLNASERLLYARANKPILEIDVEQQPFPGQEEKDLQGNFKFPLLDSSVISISGNDSKHFLQSQLTCDLNKIKPGSWVLTSWCAPNGRVKYLMTIFLTADGFSLIIDRKIAEKFLKQIVIYVLNAEVEFRDVSKSLLAFSVRQITDGKQLEPDELCLKGLSRSLDLYVAPPDVIKQKWTSISAPPISQLTKTLFDIRDRYPCLRLDQSEKFLPQELNLDQHLGLSFEKGCYPGQEIIARVKYRGTVKRNLRRLRSNKPIKHAPSDGDRLNDDCGNKVGTILSVGISPTKHLEVLSVLELSVSSFVFIEENQDELIIVDD